MTVDTNAQTRNGGSWNIAAEEPGRIVLVDPIGGEPSDELATR